MDEVVADPRAIEYQCACAVVSESAVLLWGGVVASSQHAGTLRGIMMRSRVTMVADAVLCCPINMAAAQHSLRGSTAVTNAVPAWCSWFPSAVAFMGSAGIL